MEDEKICRNCAYYIRNYMKKSTFYKPNGGYCTFQKGKIIIPMGKGCNQWERREENRAEQEKSLKAILSEMSDRLDQLIQILQNEE